MIGFCERKVIDYCMVGCEGEICTSEFDSRLQNAYIYTTTNNICYIRPQNQGLISAD